MDSACCAGIDPRPRGSLVLCRDPFDWTRNDVVDITPGVPLSLLANANGIDPVQRPVIARLDDRWVLQAEWEETFVTETSVAMFIPLPLGGDGGDLLRSVLLIAVVVLAAAATGGLAAGLLGAGFAAGTIGAAALGAGIAFGGAALVNAVIPPQLPALGDFSSSSGGGRGGASPTYSIQASGNTARIGQPIPVMYGRHIIYPDYLATPYFNYSGGHQFLNATLVIGQGEYEVEQVRIGGTPISNFEDVDYEVLGPGMSPTLFTVPMYTSQLAAGQELTASNDPDGNLAVGPFPACGANQTVSRVFVDIAFPQGLYDTDTDGDTTTQNVTWRVEARRINSLGQPISTYFVLANESRNGNTVQPLRISFPYDLPTTARWEVRVRRTSPKQLSRASASTLIWNGLRGRLAQPVSFAGITTLAVRMRASNALTQQSARQVNVIATRKLRLSSSEGFFGSPVATRQIGAAVADMLTNNVYGGGLSEDRIDWPALAVLDALWHSRQDHFDAVFDSRTTVWDAISRALRCGRAKAYMQSGIVRFHRDAPQELPVAMYGKGNIVPGSFKLTFLTHIDGETSDGVEAEYFDATIWQPYTVIASANGDTPANPAQEQLFGITEFTHAQREAAYMAAANRYRRIFASWETELDGLIASIGDLVLVANDFPRWGHSGYVEDWNPDTLTMKINEDFQFETGQSYIMRLRGQDGSVSQIVEVTEGPLENRVILSNAPLNQDGSDFDVFLPDDRVPTLWQIGSENIAFRRAIISSILPRGNTVQIEAVIEDSRVHVN